MVPTLTITPQTLIAIEAFIGAIRVLSKHQTCASKARNKGQSSAPDQEIHANEC
jgi:hypothetical protein